MFTTAKRFLFILLSANLFIFFSMGICHAGAWTQEKDRLYNRIAFNYYFADREFNDDGHRRDFSHNGEFRDMNMSNYIEYGISDRVTLINSLYIKYIKKEDDLGESKTSGVGDIDLAAKVKLLEGSWGILSTQGLLKLPGPYDMDKDLPLGNGQYDFELRMLYGRSLYPHIPGYCNLEVGYRWRFEDPSDEVRYLVEFGMDFSKYLYGRVKLDGIYSMDNGEHFDPSGNPTTSNNFDLGKLDFTVGYKISKNWGLEFDYTPEIYGQNTATGATYTIAITFQDR